MNIKSKAQIALDKAMEERGLKAGGKKKVTKLKPVKKGKR